MSCKRISTLYSTLHCFILCMWFIKGYHIYKVIFNYKISLQPLLHHYKFSSWWGWLPQWVSSIQFCPPASSPDRPLLNLIPHLTPLLHHTCLPPSLPSQCLQIPVQAPQAVRMLTITSITAADRLDHRKLGSIWLWVELQTTSTHGLLLLWLQSPLAQSSMFLSCMVIKATL